MVTQLGKLSQLKEKGMLTDNEFIAAKSKILNHDAEDSNKASQGPIGNSVPDNKTTLPPIQTCTVNIKGPADSKNMYFAAKVFYKDAGVTFEKAKESLSSGAVMKFKDKKQAMEFIEKYNEMGCKSELKEG